MIHSYSIVAIVQNIWTFITENFYVLYILRNTFWNSIGILIRHDYHDYILMKLEVNLKMYVEVGEHLSSKKIEYNSFI